MKSFAGGHSGENGAQKHSSHSTPASIDSLPELPAIPQKVRFFTACNTFIAEDIADSCLETISAIKFDAFISPLFGAIPDINRDEWSLADRVYALNTALGQQAGRRENDQIYILLDLLPNGHLLISAINPQPSAVKSEEDAQPESAEGGNREQ